MYGPDTEVYNDYPVNNNPGDLGAGGPVAQLGRYRYGQQLILGNGRKFRFGAAGGSTLAIGDLLSGPVATSSSQNLTAAIVAVGSRVLTFTYGTTMAANVMAEGFGVISVTPGAGQVYGINSHGALANAAGQVVNIDHSVRVALTATSRIDLINNNYKGLIQTPATTVASAAMGVALTATTTLRGCWIQTRGPAAVLTSGTAIAGDVVAPGLGTGGAVGPIADNAQDTQPPVGFCMFAAASGAWSTIYLMIDG